MSVLAVIRPCGAQPTRAEMARATDLTVLNLAVPRPKNQRNASMGENLLLVTTVA